MVILRMTSWGKCLSLDLDIFKNLHYVRPVLNKVFTLLWYMFIVMTKDGVA